MVNRVKNLLLLIAALVFLFSAQTAYAYSSEYSASGYLVSALDTVANFETVLQAEGLPAGKEVLFVVYKPDGSVFKIKTLADLEGRATATVPDMETFIAGIYKFEVKDLGAQGAFTVFPDEMSIEASGIYANKASVAANGVHYAEITVRIADSYGNPLEFHEVALTSNRPEDRILRQKLETDSAGLAKFLVSSKQAGVSTFTATDETAQKTLCSRAKVVFYKSDVVYREFGGDPETVLLAQAGQTVSRFVIENLPASVSMNETVDFTIKAVDASGMTVPAYAGTVRFSSTDANAQYPNPYTFQPADQGRKTFDLGLTFRTVGSQQIAVQDQNNALITGNRTVEVLSAASSTSASIRITKPATGTYSVNTLEIAGEAAPHARVQIFDNGLQIAEVNAGSSGRFSYNASLLTDGQHTLHAQSAGVQSDPVTISIDSTPAQVEQVAITNTNLAPGETTEISIHSDPDLNSVQVTVAEYIFDLEPDPQNPGIYRGTITAPMQDGEYVVNIILIDNLGNESGLTEIARLRVDASLEVGSGSTAALSVPSKVNAVTAISGNSRVTLTWQAAEAASGIAFYRIYYGTNLSSLNLVANTQDANIMWYIPNLQNGVQYYFQVVGVDANGNEGDNRSDVISAIPSADSTAEDNLVLCDPGPCPPDIEYPPLTPDDGPGVLGAILVSLAIAGGAIKFKKKIRNSNI